MRRVQTGADCRVSISCQIDDSLHPARTWTMSTSIRSTDWTRKRRSRRPSRRSTTWSRRGRRAISARRPCSPSSSQGAVPRRRNGRPRFATMQNYYNLLYREEEREMIPLCLQEGVGMIPWSPMAGGRLARARDGTARSETDPSGDRWRPPWRSTARSRSRRRGRRRSAAFRARRSRSPGCPQARRDRAHRRCDEAEPHRRRRRRPRLVLTDDEIAALEEQYVPHPISGHQ